MTTITRVLVATLSLSNLTDSASGFAFGLPPQRTTSSSTELGLFDGLKEAFSAPALERSTIDAERETPIDRWMGWSVKTDENAVVQQSEVPADFVDAMDEKNYVTAQLTKPMGIVFEENDSKVGGIFVLSVTEGGAAALDGIIKPGDQLVAVNNVKVSGKTFDEALGAIVDSQNPKTRLLLFRGRESQFYGPTGASQAWLDEFISKKSSEAKVEQ